ncbi:hypothetical protein N790_07110 [Arenimonas malthae CC-JY-1]|uniref:Glycosyl transferase family 28 C-terminal domain-containing protein n=1 Tax=Arenimonas malthae CC-JY-1 TaxID=1384054 RepID=A0A091B869_9GAMM|nr:UDP-2,4-diacetamido-2,4,6-trideoxy-beta-L-altropyranose hydrolase [Arenimonas malthae]KFN47911.1 hypothetical protein N790_07110 [Arenimonas malthae CC-JY-1]
MDVLFRADAATEIGSGHVMRCLAIAGALRVQGANCQFACRDLPGHLGGLIERQGFPVWLLATPDAAGESLLPAPPAAVDRSQADDAGAVSRRLDRRAIDWLVVDHYGLDWRWESRLRPHAFRIAVIDDLANRTHDCDLLVDQTLGRRAAEYSGLVPETASVLTGTDFAPLRGEFARWRQQSLERRDGSRFEAILVSLGGVDKANHTSRVLRALASAPLPANCNIRIVMGPLAPWLDEVRDAAAALPWRSEVHVGVSNMAELMASCDLAIGAAGTTSWERCCLGLPALTMVVADNQVQGAEALAATGASWLIHDSQELPSMISSLLDDRSQLRDMSRAASALVDGQGLDRVVREMIRGR